MIEERGIKKLLQNPIALASFAIICFYGLLALLASLGWLSSEATLTNMAQSHQAPSSEHWFGTDFLGRDVFARVIQGTKIAFIVGLFAATLSTFIGLLLGSISGYFSGWVDDIVVWLYTTLESIPYILLISAFAFSLGQGVSNLYIALGLTGWVKLCRLIRGEFLKHTKKEYVTAAKALGTSHFSRIFKHIMPNVLHLALIQFSLSFIFAIKAEVILSYLGLGAEPGTPSWGIMINDSKAELTNGIWWNLAAATFFMFFLILSINLFSDAARTALDPKSKPDGMIS